MTEKSVGDRWGDPVTKIKLGVGLALCGIGLLGALWVLLSIRGFLNGDGIHPFIAHLVPSDPAARSFQTQSGSIALPETTLVMSAVFLAAFLLWVAGSIVGLLLKTGAAILQPELRELLELLRRDVKRRG